MKYSLSSIDIYYLIEEWKKTYALIEGRIDKIYQSGDTISIKIFRSTLGNVFLNFSLPSFVYLSENNPVENADLPGFASYLRKKLSNGRIRLIKQPNPTERIIEFVIEKQEIFRLIFELIPKGNIILCDSDYTILYPLRHAKFSDRIVRPKETYKFPESDDFLVKENFVNVFKNSKSSVVKTLAKDISIGGAFAEELCSDLSINKEREASRLPSHEIHTLFTKFKEFFGKNIEIYHNDKHFYPFILKSKPDLERFDGSFNKALEMYSLRKSAESKPKKTKEMIKAESITESQRQTIEKYKEAIKENQEKGETIYHNYQQISDLLNHIKDLKKEKSYSEIKNILLKDPKYKSILSHFDDKKMKMVLDI